MRIATLTSKKGSYSIKRLKEASEAKGHKFCIIDINECFVNITNNDPKIYTKNGKVIPELNAIIPRIEPDLSFFGTAILRQFEILKVYPLNNSLAIIRALDKLRSLQILAKHKIAMPMTGIAHSPSNTESIIKSIGRTPLIIKLVEGAKGNGIVLAETDSAAKSVINAFKQLNVNILVQEFIRESSGRNIRCFVVGNKVAASMELVAQEGEYRASFHLGAEIKSIKITAEEKSMAIAATKAIGLDVAGVDILRSKRGPLVLEINASPKLEEIEKITGIDVASLMISYIEKNAKPYNSKNTK